MSDILEMFRKTLEEESKMLGTPDSCTINRVMELISDAYQLGNEKSDEQKLREKYAGMALQGIIGNPLLLDATIEQAKDNQEDEVEVICKGAVEWADSLIEQLKKHK